MRRWRVLPWFAMADGSISSEEKQKWSSSSKAYALSIFTTSDVIKAFQDFVGQLEFDKDIGEAKAYQAIGKMKSNTEASRLLVRMIIAIASSDGLFDNDEKKIAVKIAKELGDWSVWIWIVSFLWKRL